MQAQAEVDRVPMSQPDPEYIWPIRPPVGQMYNNTLLHKRIRSAPCAFGSPRGSIHGVRRRTIGTTVPCDFRDTIVVPLRSRAVTSWPWEEETSMLLLAAERVFVGLGVPRDAPTRGIKYGQEIQAGTEIARGMPRGIHFVMFERPEGMGDLDFLARCSVPKFFLWIDECPDGLLNPTVFLADALNRLGD